MNWERVLSGFGPLIIIENNFTTQFLSLQSLSVFPFKSDTAPPEPTSIPVMGMDM